MADKKSDGSPNGIALDQKPLIARMGKWPLYVGIGIASALFSILIYSVQFAHDPNEKKEDEMKKVPVAEEDKPVWLMDGAGLALDPRKERTSGIIQTGPDLSEQPIQITINKSEPKEEKQALPVNNELENIRRLRTQSYMTALSSPLVAKKLNQNDPGQQGAPGNAQVRNAAYTDPDINSMMKSMNPEAAAKNDNFDPTAAKDREQFFDRAKSGDQWDLGDKRTAGKTYELQTGSVIPAVMVSGINSDLPGTIIGQVSQNVYDSPTGLHLLIPQGSKLYGVYDSRVAYGQDRVLIAWNRLIFPDGSSVTLGAMPGADMSGMAGFNDQTNNHYFRIFGSAFLMSLVTGGMSYAMDSVNNNNQTNTSMNGNSTHTSVTNEMTAAFAQQLGQTTMQLIQKNLNISPTLEIRPGYQFNIVVTKDIVFDSPYTRWRR